jgi:RNA polymerase primary sigma factor
MSSDDRLRSRWSRTGITSREPLLHPDAVTRDDTWRAAPIAAALEHRLLRPEEERRLALRAARGDAGARDALVVGNLRLVVSVAHAHRAPGASLADLVQEGICGLLTAVDRFDVSRGVRFSTYATWWIRASIGEASRRMQPVPLPRPLEAKRRRLAVAVARGARLDGDDEQVATVSGLTVAQVSEARAALRLQSPVRLDERVGDSDTPLLELHEDRSAPSHVEIAQERLRRRDIDRLLDALPHREREILRRRFGLDGASESTLEDVARSLGVSRETVRKVELRLLDELSDMPEAQPLRDAV